MEHVAVFKVLLDKTHSLNEKKSKGYLGKRDLNKFEKLGEIDDELNSVVKALDGLSEEDRGCLVEMKGELQENAKLLKEKSEMKLFEFTSVLCEMQMAKLENKIIFLDEYEKLLHHERVFLKVHQGQLLAEKLKLTGMKQKQLN